MFRIVIIIVVFHIRRFRRAFVQNWRETDG